MLKEMSSLVNFEWNTEKAITLYDQIADAVDSTFPDMMQKSHHCPKSRSTLLRQVEKLLLKAHCILLRSVMRHLVVDNEGFRTDIRW